jgi:serine/threonine-protein kinase
MAAPGDLLFGMLALQNGLIDAEALLAAFRAWTLDRGRALAEHLVERGALDGAQRAALEALAELHRKKHGGDDQRSLAALPVGSSIRTRLEAVGDPELTVTLETLGSGSTDSDRTFRMADAAGDGPRYRILRPHARGGLGAVFVALDAELNREVALKQILGHHADDPRSRLRFLLEAEVTGGLEHPGIVPVYGLGAYEDGRPYYAMRFIRGDSLKEAIAAFHGDEALRSDAGRRSLELRKLLRRFMDVCNAIEYAHSRGVLHRDIKPANVIVGQHGETLVVDWGLAKVGGQAEGIEPGDERPLAPSSASGSAETLPGSAMGTPAYMSPEQARGDLDALGPRSDVYSLGATLYSLLTGRPPFEAGDAGAILRGVQRGEFPPPRRLDPGIDRALEAVCLRAMATRPGDRYDSARALAEDVERWLADEPVRAWSEPWTRRLARWLARHRTRVAAASAAGLAALVGLGALALVQTRNRDALAHQNLLLREANGRAHRANAALRVANDRAEAGERRARLAADTFFTRVSEERLLEVPGLQPLRLELLELALGYYRQFLREHAGDASLRRDEARARLRVGVIRSLLGSDREALEELDRAGALLEALPGGEAEGPGNLYLRSKVAGARGVSLEQLGRFPEAVAAYREAAGFAARQAERVADAHAARRELAHELRNLGGLLDKIGRYPEAREALTRSIAAGEALLAESAGDAVARSDLALALASLAYLDTAEGRVPQAIEDCRRSTRLLRERLDQEPADLGARYDLAHGLIQEAALARLAGRIEDGRAAAGEAIGALSRLADLSPRVPSYRRDLAMAYNTLGDLERASGRTDALGASAEKARDLLEAIRRDPSHTLEIDLELSKAYNNLGRFEAAEGRDVRARAAFLRAAELLGSSGRVDALVHYNIACNLALAMPPDDPDDRARLGDRAIRHLRAAVDGGFGMLDVLRADTDLDALRDREDFRRMLLDVAFPDDPFAP